MRAPVVVPPLRVVDKAVERLTFDTWIQSQLVLTPSNGDAVTLYNIAVHKCAPSHNA